MTISKALLYASIELGARGQPFGYVSEGTTPKLRAANAENKALPAGNQDKIDTGKIITAMKASNVVKVLGYIPIIGTIIGLVRVIFASIRLAYLNSKSCTLSKEEKQERKKNYAQILGRGLVEMIPGAGLILAPVDACVAIHDYRKLKAAEKDLVEVQKFAKEMEKIVKEINPALEKMEADIVQRVRSLSPEIGEKASTFFKKMEAKINGIFSLFAAASIHNVKDLMKELPKILKAPAVQEVLKDIKTELPGLLVEVGVNPELVQKGIALVTKHAHLIAEVSAGKFDGLKGLTNDLKELKNQFVRLYPAV